MDEDSEPLVDPSILPWSSARKSSDIKPSANELRTKVLCRFTIDSKIFQLLHIQMLGQPHMLMIGWISTPSLGTMILHLLKRQSRSMSRQQKLQQKIRHRKKWIWPHLQLYGLENIPCSDWFMLLLIIMTSKEHPTYITIYLVVHGDWKHEHRRVKGLSVWQLISDSSCPSWQHCHRSILNSPNQFLPHLILWVTCNQLKQIKLTRGGSQWTYN